MKRMLPFRAAPLLFWLCFAFASLHAQDAQEPPRELPVFQSTSAEAPEAAIGPSVQEVNKALELPLFSAHCLWEEADYEVAKRLGWPEESRTKSSSSYRIYPPQGWMPVAGTKAYTASLYGTDGKMTGVSFIFANKGDIEQMAQLERVSNEREAKRELDKAKRDYKSMIRKDEKQLADTLDALFGPHKIDKTGDSQDTRELVKRWDWRGHTFFLSAPRGEYVALRVLPTIEADNPKLERIPRAEFKKMLAERVVRRENGDVILSELPMVNQGPKGYCMPATWERALRYMGIPADMYVLAMAGGTAVGGGTNLDAMKEGVNGLLRRYGRRLNQFGGPVSIRTVAPIIDKGQPILWVMFSTDEYNEAVNSRMAERKNMTDAAAWKARLADARKAAKKFKPNRSSGHVCMIIGYNKQTDEVAVSDSWGPFFAERWVTVEEAQAVSQGTFLLID
jgi:hypothetical protein